MIESQQEGWQPSDGLLITDPIAWKQVDYAHGPSALADEGMIPDDGMDALEAAAAVALAELADEAGDAGDPVEDDLDDDEVEDDPDGDVPPDI